MKAFSASLWSVSTFTLFCSFLAWAGIGMRSTAIAQAELPDGDARALVLANCTRCHDTRVITAAGFTRQDWGIVTSSMVSLPEDQMTAIGDYLHAHFPERRKPPAVLISGAVKTTIKDWSTPTPGARPHDPLAVRDGSIWWTGQWSNVLGHLDPNTGDMKEFGLPPESGPVGLAEDAAGAIWFTANSAGYIGKLDPKTSLVNQFMMPNPAATTPAGSSPQLRPNPASPPTAPCSPTTPAAAATPCRRARARRPTTRARAPSGSASRSADRFRRGAGRGGSCAWPSSRAAACR